MTRKSATGRNVKRAKIANVPGKKKGKLDAPHFPIVGIGASAGGVEASVELLSRLSPDLSMALVIIHHLSPNFHSNLTEILQRHTQMPVHKVSDHMKVLPGHVYVIPPDAFIELEVDHLRLKKRLKRDPAYHPIDYFMISLARERNENAMGILLSGTAHDGTLGLQAIKEAGGITMAQDETAGQSQMSQSAQDAGYVDFILSPQRMAEELLSLNDHPFVELPLDQQVLKNEASIKKILNLILSERGVDFFSHYKRTTVFRRIMRRMAILKIKSLTAYLKMLKGSGNEVEALYHDFLINVTSFFREPAFYNDLGKHVFPKLIRNLKPTDPIRIWIAGCATGEEAYSTAICLQEFLQKKKRRNPVNIFATDLSARAIEKARLGIYPRELVQHISPQRLKKFFVRLDGRFQVEKSTREMCVFSQHNLLKDPPFSRVDLVSCQNVMIYLEPVAQKRIFKVFHYALKPSGFLLMGRSESIAAAADLFQPSEDGGRMFVRRAVAPQRLDFADRLHSVSPATALQMSTERMHYDVEKEADRLLLSRYMPASVLVNKDLEILLFRGSTSAYLEPAAGKASLNLLKMVRDEFLFDLRSAIQRAKKSGLHAVQETVANRPINGVRVNIEVNPIQSGSTVHYLIVFREVHDELPISPRRKEKRGSQSTRIQQLEQALANARDQSRVTTDEFEATRGELQSANEEILSSNEELQSINEEIETSKEELQSANEELTTINEELQIRNVEFKQAGEYAEAIIETMRGPLMVLDNELRVRTANRAFYEFFKLDKNETEGAPLYELGGRQWRIPALMDQLHDIFPKKMDFKDFVILHHFPGIGDRTMIINAQRLIPGEQKKESMILLSFEDITRYVTAEKALRETQEKLQLALEGGAVGTWAWDIETDELKVSPEDEELYGLSRGMSMQTFEDWKKAIHPSDREAIEPALQRSVTEAVPLDTEFRVIRSDGSVRWIMAKANPYFDAEGKPEKMMGICIDITDRKNALEALEESEKRFRSISDQAPVMIWTSAADGDITFLNKTSLLFTGQTLEEACGQGWFSCAHPEDRARFTRVYHDAFAKRTEFKIDYRLKRHDGEYRWVMNHGVPRFAGEDIFIGFIGTCADITDRIDLERQKDDFMGIASHELKTPVTSIKAYAQILQEKFRKVNDEASTHMLTRLDAQIDKLTGLINTLLDVAKVQSGQMDYDNAFFEVEAFIREVAEDMQDSFPTHKILTEITDGEIYGDRQRLTQVLTNLISNAVKYSPQGRAVIVKAVRDEKNYVISVQDFGVGISKDVQDKIFGRFFRVHDSEGNRVSGLGLGLFISSQIVKQQGGDIWLDSEPGKGSVFYLSLPVRTN